MVTIISDFVLANGSRAGDCVAHEAGCYSRCHCPLYFSLGVVLEHLSVIRRNLHWSSHEHGLFIE